VTLETIQEKLKKAEEKRKLNLTSSLERLGRFTKINEVTERKASLD